MKFDDIVDMVRDERARQTRLHDNSGETLDKMTLILLSEVGEVINEVISAGNMREQKIPVYHGGTVEELVQVAAMAFQILEGFDGTDFHF
jgi:NTP pyrophosphatase (non-canonical NTP hydrolase)